MAAVFAIVQERVISMLLDNMQRLLREGLFGDNLAAEITQWKTELMGLCGVLQDAEDKKEIMPALGDWLQDLEALTYDIEDLFDSYNYDAFKKEVEGSPGMWKQICDLPYYLLKKRKMSGTSNQIKERLQRLKDRKEEYKLSYGPVRPPKRSSRLASSSLAETEVIVFGRDDDKLAIRALLSEKKSNAFEVIAIVGVGGLGKTTLARCAYNDDQLISTFDVKVCVCVSADYEDIKITTQILKAVSPDCNVADQGSNWIKEQLRKSLSNKRFLIVLDDLWNEKPGDWHELRSPFFAGLVGSRVIVTTRSHVVADMVRTVNSVTPQLLSDEDCHSLVCEHAGLDRNDEASIYVEMAKKIAKKCSGLPLAAVGVGGLLRNTERREDWEHFLNSKSWMSDDGRMDVMSVLKMSYDALDPQLKRCFSFFAMLPEDYKFAELEIVLIWIGVGIVQHMEGFMSKKQVGHDCFHQLLSRSFFSVDSVRSFPGAPQFYVMHDLVRDLALQVSERNRYIGKVDAITESFKSSRHIFCHTSRFQDVVNSIVKEREVHLPLRTFFTFGYKHVTGDELNDLFSRTKLIRTFSCGWVKDLPMSITHLKLLTYLDLSDCCFDSLPDSFTTLYSLEILFLRKCYQLLQLPESIGILMKLCHLDVSNCWKLTKLPVSIARLQNLIHLNVSSCYKLKELPKRIGELQNLTHLDVSRCEKLKGLPVSIGELQNLTHLDVSRCEKLKGLPVSIGELQNLTHLDVSECERLKGLPVSIGELQDLAHLDLSGCENLKELPESIWKLQNLLYLDVSRSSLKKLPGEIVKLQKLCHLGVSGCLSLEKIPYEIGELQNLCYLDADRYGADLPSGIGTLKKLRNLPTFRIGRKLSLSSLENLKSLQGRLTISCLENVASPQDARLARLSDKRLYELTLIWSYRKSEQTQVEIKREEEILDFLQPHQNLKRLTICGYCGSKFPHWLLASLRCLTYLSIIEWKNGTALLTTLEMPSLKTLQIYDCPLLVMKLPQILPQLLSLKELNIRQCPSDALKLIMEVQLPNLTKLTMENWERITVFPSEDTELESIKLTRSVSHLTLINFPDLKRISSFQVLGLLSNVTLSGCKRLESFPDDELPPSVRCLSINACPRLAIRLSKISHTTEIYRDYRVILRSK